MRVQLTFFHLILSLSVVVIFNQQPVSKIMTLKSGIKFILKVINECIIDSYSPVLLW